MDQPAKHDKQRKGDELSACNLIKRDGCSGAAAAMPERTFAGSPLHEFSTNVRSRQASSLVFCGGAYGLLRKIVTRKMSVDSGELSTRYAKPSFRQRQVFENRGFNKVSCKCIDIVLARPRNLILSRMRLL